MTQAAHSRLGRRLRRILILLPYAISHPGVSVDELAAKFNVPRGDLFDDLNLVFLCGLPGYGPGDLIDVSFEEDRVYVRMADYFATPLRLTPAEALALYAGGQAIAELPDMAEAGPLKSGLRKLGRALGQRDDDDKGGVTVGLQYGLDQHLSVLRRALTQNRQVSLEYFSASRGVITKRTIDPWGLVAALGRWYLIAFDHLAQDERMFRTDRMKRVELTDAPMEVPGDFETEPYRTPFPATGGDKLVLEISPQAARWFGDYHQVERSETLEDGWTRVELGVGGERWAAMLLLRLGRDARSIAPESVVLKARELAALIADRHSS